MAQLKRKMKTKADQAKERFIEEFGKGDSTIGQGDAITSQDLVLGFSKEGRQAFRTEYLRTIENYSEAVLVEKAGGFDAVFVSENRTISLVNLDYLLRAIKVLGNMDHLDRLEFYVCDTEDRNPVFIESDRTCIAIAPRTMDEIGEESKEELKEKSKTSQGVFPGYTSDDFTKIRGIGPKTAENLKHHGFFSFEDLNDASDHAIAKVPGVGKKTAKMIKENL